MVIGAFLSVLLGFVGNLMNNVNVFKYFLFYFVATLFVIVIMFMRVTLLKVSDHCYLFSTIRLTNLQDCIVFLQEALQEIPTNPKCRCRTDSSSQRD